MVSLRYSMNSEIWSDTNFLYRQAIGRSEAPSSSAQPARTHSRVFRKNGCLQFVLNRVRPTIDVMLNSCQAKAYFGMKSSFAEQTTTMDEQEP